MSKEDKQIILSVFNSILDDETLLDSLSTEQVEEFYTFLGFYLYDREEFEIELDFNE